jgi:hypothetical protein
MKRQNVCGITVLALLRFAPDPRKRQPWTSVEELNNRNRDFNLLFDLISISTIVSFSPTCTEYQVHGGHDGFVFLRKPTSLVPFVEHFRKTERYVING